MSSRAAKMTYSPGSNDNGFCNGGENVCGDRTNRLDNTTEEQRRRQQQYDQEGIREFSAALLELTIDYLQHVARAFDI